MAETKIRDQGRWKISRNQVRHERSGVFQGRIDRCFSPYRLAGACSQADACGSHYETQNISWRFRRLIDRKVRRCPNPLPASRFEAKDSMIFNWMPDRHREARETRQFVKLQIMSNRRMEGRAEQSADPSIDDERVRRVRCWDSYRATTSCAGAVSLRHCE